MVEQIQEQFFSAKQIERSLVVLCENSTHTKDPVTNTVIIMITCPLQVQLTATGLQPFQGRELTFPYESMLPEQQRVLRGLLEQSGSWVRHECCLIFSQREAVTLPVLLVLEGMCRNILEGTVHKDRRVRVAACNIILQRVRSSIPLSKNTAAQLNQNLFQTELQVPDEVRDKNNLCTTGCDKNNL